MKKLQFGAEMMDLTQALSVVKHGLGASKTDMAVMMMRVTVNETSLNLFASDKEVFVRTTCPIKNVGGVVGSFGVMGSRLLQLASQVNSELVNFEVDEENVEVNAGFLTVNFELYDDTGAKATETSLEAEASALMADGHELPRRALEEGLQCAKSCTTTNSLRPDLTHAEIRNGRLLSSDGRKILVLTHDGFPKEMSFKIPAVALNALMGAVKNAECEQIKLVEGKSYYFLAGTNVLLGVRKIERVFPSVEDMITNTDTPTDEISIDKLVLESMVRGVALGLQGDDVRVTLDVGGTGMEAYVEVNAVNGLGRRSHERASCGRKATGTLSFPISFRHLLTTLDVFKGDSVVDMLVLTTRSILMVRDTTDEREVLTVIPFRTQQAVDQERKDADALAAAKVKKVAEAIAEVDAVLEAPDDL